MGAEFQHLSDEQVTQLFMEELSHNRRTTSLFCEYLTRQKYRLADNLSKLKPPIDHSAVERELGKLNMLGYLASVCNQALPQPGQPN